MIQKNKRYQHFLWICRKIGRVPAEMAADVACLDPRDEIDMGKYKVSLVVIKNTQDGKLYMLDLYEDGKLIRRSPCYLTQPKHVRSYRMAAEMVGLSILVGFALVGAATAYFFADDLADTLMTQSSCEILRFDVFHVDPMHVYYVVEAQNSSTQTGEFSMSLRAETGGMHDNPDVKNLVEFESHSWSATAQFTGPLVEKSDYLVEVKSTDIGSGDIVCTAKTTSK